MRRRTAAHLVAATSAGAMALACNAIVGNEDIRFGSDAGGVDATTIAEAGVESGVTAEAGSERGDAGYDAPPDAADATPDAGDAGLEAACEAGTKACAGACVTLDDPGYGCGPTHCSPCELPNAVAGCGAPDGGADGGVLACDVAVCKGTHADCNGTPLDGCETDTSDDLYNCGACGHDCSNLPHVAGNVSCTAGVCTFDDSACAPGYGICTTNPDNGCDTVISDPVHCGGCATSCTAGFPYCSPTGSAAHPFSMHVGLRGGAELVRRVVRERADRSEPLRRVRRAMPCRRRGHADVLGRGQLRVHLQRQRPPLRNRQRRHRAPPTTTPPTAASAPPAASAVAPANASPTCTGGTTCGYVCNPGAHACGCRVRPQQRSEQLRDRMCGTNCPGPDAGKRASRAATGTSAPSRARLREPLRRQSVRQRADGQRQLQRVRATSCDAGQSLQRRPVHCNAASCPNGCCDGTGTCQTASTSATCGTAGHACAAGCPAALPEAQHLVLWLVGDGYASGATTWADQSGHAPATCSSCPTTSAGALNGHTAVSFDGTSYFALGDPGGLYQTSGLHDLRRRGAGSRCRRWRSSNAQLIAFSDGSGTNSLGLQQSDADPDLLLQLLHGLGREQLARRAGRLGFASVRDHRRRRRRRAERVPRGRRLDGRQRIDRRARQRRLRLLVPRDRSGVADAELHRPGRRGPGVQHDARRARRCRASRAISRRATCPAVRDYFFGRAQTPNS